MLQKEICFYTATFHQRKPLIRDLNFETIILQSLSFIHKKNASTSVALSSCLITLISGQTMNFNL